jgi:hypothetical protein
MSASEHQDGRVVEIQGRERFIKKGELKNKGVQCGRKLKKSSKKKKKKDGELYE